MLRTDQITELAPYVGTYWGPQKLPQIYTVIAYICIGRLRDLQYIFAVTYATLCISELPSDISTMSKEGKLHRAH